MNQPTREEFEEFKQEIRQEVRQLREQRTEEIKAVRVEVASEDVIKRLDKLEEGQEEIKEDTSVTKIQMEGARADILKVRESQADLRDRLIEHGSRLSSIETKQDAHSEVLEQLVNIGESHTGRFDQIDTRFDRLETLMLQMLDRLPKTEGE